MYRMTAAILSNGRRKIARQSDGYRCAQPILRATSGASADEVERRRTMSKTKSLKELVQGRVKADKKFAEALLREGIDAMLSGDVDTGKAILRDYIKATVGFEELGEATGAPPKSLIRMFGPRGNPQAKNLFSVIGYLKSAPASA